MRVGIMKHGRISLKILISIKVLFQTTKGINLLVRFIYS
jgi:hypothetical protein